MHDNYLHVFQFKGNQDAHQTLSAKALRFARLETVLMHVYPTDVDQMPTASAHIIWENVFVFRVSLEIRRLHVYPVNIRK